jgi:hypothetical protein
VSVARLVWQRPDAEPLEFALEGEAAEVGRDD